jgi:hypothetical protein
MMRVEEINDNGRLWRVRRQARDCCCLYFHFNRVFLTVVHKGNGLILLLDAIDSDSRLAVSPADL